MAYSEAQKKASMKYNRKNYERIYMYVLPEDKKAWQSEADRRGVSLSEFVKKCVSDKIFHDNMRQ